MIKKILKKISSENGAMDKILVTLLLVIVAVASIVALEQWNTTQKDKLLNSSENIINQVNNTY